MTTLDELGRKRFRATVGICPECLSLFDGKFLADQGDGAEKPVMCNNPNCEGVALEILRVSIADD